MVIFFFLLGIATEMSYWRHYHEACFNLLVKFIACWQPGTIALRVQTSEFRHKPHLNCLTCIV